MSRVGHFLVFGMLCLLPLVPNVALAHTGISHVSRYGASASPFPDSDADSDRGDAPKRAVASPSSQQTFMFEVVAFFEFLAGFFEMFEQHVTQTVTLNEGSGAAAVPSVSSTPESLPTAQAPLALATSSQTSIPSAIAPQIVSANLATIAPRAIVAATSQPNSTPQPNGLPNAELAVVVSFFGWGDNTPPDSAQIAYPATRYVGAKHATAGGQGTWSDPITFGSSVNEFPVGTILWLPMLQKYVVMEDDCAACDAAWSNGRHYKIAVWTGAATTQQVYSEQNCETALSKSMAGSGNPLPIVIAPPSSEPVSTTPLFNATNGACLDGVSYDNTPNATTGVIAQLSPASTATAAAVPKTATLTGSSVNLPWSNGQAVPASFLTNVFANAGPFYQPLPTNPAIASYSSSAISYYYAGNPEFDVGFLDGDSSQAQYDYSFPVYVASNSDPLVTIACSHVTPADCADGGVQIHLPSQAKQAGGGDHHLAVLQPNGIEYDFWLVTSNPPYGNGSSISAAGEAHFMLNGSNFGTAFVAPGFDVGAATAGGIALLIGQIYTSELASGTIDHAISLIYPCGTTSWVYPSTQVTGICANGQGMPLGSRLWWAPDDAQTQAMSLPRDITTILIAMHHYGAFFTDNGGGSSNLNGQGVGAGAHLENQEPYWLYGNGSDPALNYAISAGWKHITNSSGVNRYLLSAPGSSVNFLDNLKVLDPCVTQQTCS